MASGSNTRLEPTLPSASYPWNSATHRFHSGATEVQWNNLKSQFTEHPGAPIAGSRNNFLASSSSGSTGSISTRTRKAQAGPRTEQRQTNDPNNHIRRRLDVGGAVQRRIGGLVGHQPKAKREYYDLVIVGSGPAGLTTTLYAAREGIEILVIEKGGIGG